MNILCDLDGVIYRGGQVISGVPEALQRLDDADVGVFYMTNNSTRTPEQGAKKIADLTGVAVSPSQMLSSSLAAVELLGAGDGPVLCVGEDGVAHAVAAAGLRSTTEPDQARSVLVGLMRDIDYDTLDRAMNAVRAGARFIATNVDTTFPTEDGLAPGAGAIVAAIAAAADAEPEVAGKPYPAMRKLIRSRGVGEAWVIGDRLDTDIAIAADEPDWRSILVLTGVTSGEEAEESMADHVADDFASAVDLVLGAFNQS